MGHDTGELRLVLRGGDGSDVDEDGSTRKSEGVDFFLRNDVKLVWPGILGGIAEISFFPSCWTYWLSGLESGRTGICL